MSDIVEQARELWSALQADTRGVGLDKAGNFCQSPAHEAFERFCYRRFPELLAEIERLRAETDRQYAELVRAQDELGGLLHRVEAQRDALVVAAEPFVSECLTWPDYVPDGDYLFIASPDDIEPILDEYASLCGSKSAGVSFSNDTVTVGNLRALSAAVAGAKEPT